MTPVRVRTLVAWFRYRGWRNRYWREDWAHATCPHDGSRWSDDHQTICALCGAVVGPGWNYGITVTSGTANDYTIRMFLRQ